MKKIVHVIMSFYVCLSITCIYLMMRRNIYLEDQNKRQKRHIRKLIYEKNKGTAIVLSPRKYTKEEIDELMKKVHNKINSHKNLSI